MCELGSLKTPHQRVLARRASSVMIRYSRRATATLTSSSPLKSLPYECCASVPCAIGLWPAIITDAESAYGFESGGLDVKEHASRDSEISNAAVFDP